MHDLRNSVKESKLETKIDVEGKTKQEKESPGARMDGTLRDAGRNGRESWTTRHDAGRQVLPATGTAPREGSKKRLSEEIETY